MRELEDVRMGLECDKSQLMIENANHVALMEHQLSNLKLKVTCLEELKEEAIMVNNKLNMYQNDFYHGLSQIQQEHHNINNANDNLDERIIELYNF